MNSTMLCIAFAILGAAVSRAADPSPIRLWPGMAPGETGGIGPEKNATTPSDQLIAGKAFIRLTNVSDPTMTVYSPSAETGTGTAVVVFPGGGYNILAYDHEGTEICRWLNSIGVTAVLVKYRVPARPGRERYAAALQDAQRAVGLVRWRAKEFGIDPGRIGTIGFSAGGHLSATLCANAGGRTYPAADGADGVSCRPDFQMLLYPAYLLATDSGLTLAPEVAVTGATPPTFLVMAQDDPIIHVESALGYAAALQEAKVPMELHVYPTGGHGFGLRPTGDFATSWPRRAADWMRSRGLLDRK
jgi:acetyl esterase/lipase